MRSFRTPPFFAMANRIGGAVSLVAFAGLAQAHPGHGAPDIIHDLDTAAGFGGAAAGSPVLALLLGLAGVAMLLLGPAAGLAGRRLPTPVLRVVRPLGAAALLAAAALGLGAL